MVITQLLRKDIPVKVTLYHTDNNERKSEVIATSMYLDGENNVLRVNLYNLTHEERQLISNKFGKFINHKDISMRCNIDTNTYKVFIREDLCFNHCYLENNNKYLSASLRRVEIMKCQKVQKNIFYLSSAANELIGYLSKLDTKNGVVVGEKVLPLEFSYNGYSYLLTHDKEQVLVETTNDSIDDILPILSLYCATNVESYMNIVKNNAIVKSTNRQPYARKHQNQCLRYLYSHGENLMWFRSFIHLFEGKQGLTEQINRYIKAFVRAEDFDTITQLVIYCSILDSMANVQKQEYTDLKIKQFLEVRHIDTAKINQQVIDKKLHYSGEQIINFIQLRHFFIHHMGSKEAELFLKESILLEQLRLVISFLLLGEMGISDLRIDDWDKGMSVFDSTISSVHHVEDLLTGKL